MTISIYIPFAIDPHDDAVNIKRDKQAKLDIYFKVIQCAFASISRFSHTAHAALITNEEPPQEVRDFLSSLGCAIKVVPFEHNPRGAAYRSFNASFYMLDAMKYVSEMHQELGSIFFLDPDCLVMRDLSNVTLGADGVFALPLDITSDTEMNGMTPRQASSCADDILRTRPCQPHIHYGGEFYAGRKDSFRKLVVINEELWQGHLGRLSQGRSAFTTEEHLLSAAIAALNQGPETSAADIVARFWTTAKVSNWSFRNRRVAIAHLPAEKDSGFLWLYNAIRDTHSVFWNRSDAYVRLLIHIVFGLWPAALGIGNALNALRRSLLLPLLRRRSVESAIQRTRRTATTGLGAK